ncbi:MAG TPA: hypothetical protein VGN96_11085 [Roseococcus sp.]|jgi:hypothetical protein|nr:hypothetical protein [Roseococcus sp.]
MARFMEEERRILRLADWPALERGLWQGAMATRDRPLSGHAYVRRLAEATLGKAARGYGRWLTFLTRRGWLEAVDRPSGRVTPERLDAYFHELCDLENADYTVVGRIGELVSALRIMEPRGEHGWILRPGGLCLRDFLAMERQVHVLHHPADLFLWGLDLMAEAREIAHLQQRGPQLRDGLLISIEALRGLRLRSVLSLRLEDSILRDPLDGVWHLRLPPEDVKNRRHIEGAITRILAPWIDRYVEVERREMLRGAVTDAFWVGYRGGALSESGLSNAVAVRSAARFGPGAGFRTHRFRHCLASTLPLLVPEHPYLASQLLRISQATMQKHYDRSGDVLAFRQYHDALAAERRRLAPRARALMGPVS